MDDEDLAFLMYTSGTTGRPKGAMLSHQNLVVNTMNWIHEVGAGPDDVWLSGLPLFHIGGLNGRAAVPLPRRDQRDRRPRRLRPGRARSSSSADHDVTMCFFVPTQWQDICSRPEVAALDVSRLRVAMWGASSAPQSTLELLTRTFPSVQIVNAFGQTEMSSNTAFLKGEDAVRKMGSIGHPAIDVEVRIVDEDGRDVPRGEVGEIVYRGPTVMHGYFDNAEATAEAFAGGWFHSGDLVREDDEGFLYVVDRLKDMLISGGENVYPAEVERALLEHPGRRGGGGGGHPPPALGRDPAGRGRARARAARSPRRTLIEHCRARLAGYKKPSAVVFADALPRNAAGKVLKRALRDAHREHLTTAGTQSPAG